MDQLYMMLIAEEYSCLFFEQCERLYRKKYNLPLLVEPIIRHNHRYYTPSGPERVQKLLNILPRNIKNETLGVIVMADKKELSRAWLPKHTAFRELVVDSLKTCCSGKLTVLEEEGILIVHM